jgi:hypothetical protein
VDSVTVRANAYAARRDVNVMVVLDRSASLKNVGAWDDVQQAARSFILKFDNNRDRVGLVSFGTGANVDYPLSTGFKTSNIMLNLIFNQVVPNSAYTNSALGMWLAYSELLRVGDKDALNAIVFFTDGQPSAFSATFRVRPLLASGTAPRCLTDTEEGTLGTGQDTSVWNSPQFFDIRGFWRREAGPVPVNLGNLFYDHPLNLRCLNILDVYGGNVEALFDSSEPWPDRWTGSELGSPAKTFCIDDDAGGCLGDAGDFPYDRSNTNLFNNNSSTKYYRGANVHNAAKNLLLNIAQTARQDSAALGGVVIHTIGLGGYGYDADAELMKRVANDPTPAYGVTGLVAAPGEPVGSYTYAPSIGDIEKAFDKVRSEVMRLTR